MLCALSVGGLVGSVIRAFYVNDQVDAGGCSRFILGLAPQIEGIDEMKMKINLACPQGCIRNRAVICSFLVVALLEPSETRIAG